MNASTPNSLAHGLFLLAVFGAAYFAPTLIANNKKKANTGAIFALNLLAGWTVICWVVALVWSLTAEKSPVVYRDAA